MGAAEAVVEDVSEAEEPPQVADESDWLEDVGRRESVDGGLHMSAATAAAAEEEPQADRAPSQPRTDGVAHKQGVQARAVARSESPSRGASAAARGGDAPAEDMSTLSPELQAMIDAPPFTLDNFRTPIPTKAERKELDVAMVVANDPSCKHIHWERSGATDVDVSKLVDALKANTHVRTVNLAGNREICGLDGDGPATGLVQLEVMLTAGQTPITALHLAGTSVDRARVLAARQLGFANALRQVKANDPTLRELVFCGTGFDDVDAQALAAVLPGNTALETLRFGSAGRDRALTDAGASALAVAIPECNIVALSLSFTSVTPAKARSLHELCLGNATSRLHMNDESLRVLSFRNLGGEAGLLDEDVCTLSNALEGNTTLQTIDLWGNTAVSDKSATDSSSLSKGLMKCVESSKVEWVRLDWTASDQGKDIVSQVRRATETQDKVRKVCVANAALNPAYRDLFPDRS